MVIIKSKITGEFLRQHSGSARALCRRIYYQVLRDETLNLPKKRRDDNWYSYRNPDKRENAILLEVHKRMYNAEALEAHRYANSGSALPSIGMRIGSSLAPEARSRAERCKRRYVLPENLEIHEVVGGNLCLVNSNDSPETKLKKKKQCKQTV
jgi:hypothetical protein